MSQVVLTSPCFDSQVLRLLDANLDRAREGLRVAEDWARFGIDRRDLVEQFKDLRHQLGRCHRQKYRQARHTASDGAAGLSHPAQGERHQPAAVVAANCARAQEALRVLEEFGRAGDPELAVVAEACRYRLYDLETQLLADQSRRQRLREARLYLITSPVPQMLEVVEQSLQAGVRLVQYRSKSSEDGQRYEEALALRQLCSRHNALFIVNDRLDIALAVDADGVHLGQADLPITQARRLLGPDRLIGQSTHCLDDLGRAMAEGCDYIGVGPIYVTPTKPGRSAVGFDYLREAAANTKVPFFAIGGIEAGNIGLVLENGGPTTAVAVVRAVMEAADPAMATRELIERIQHG
jgi:thiamine-phosphate pyrophosphorylase